ncbi:ParB/Srx family N-terminal domain-containing protein [Microcystis sp. M061S2]|uniref:ParB/Srx family N-terminal domain-containing protein n=1 Tax=Microcystis sp. M061S2 TaxID=2771171 RepID=UPI0025908571|nr:ParB/Srx family N-terminal domain-containing protein [Microcystis sp. M061S2]MCA2656377.1 ParB N-terminal domain-containing protein [Microcystis sp. M061S2]
MAKRQVTPTVHCKFSEMVKPEKLKPNPQNANQHPEDQIERLVKIITEHGWRHPIVVSEDSGFIVSGHGRLEAAIKAKWDKVPVAFQKFESNEQEFQVMTADNAIARWAEIDLSKVHDAIKEIGPFDLELMGFKDFKFEPNFEPGTEDEQGKLDKKQLKFITCPHCEKEFELGQAKVRTED